MTVVFVLTVVVGLTGITWDLYRRYQVAKLFDAIEQAGRSHTRTYLQLVEARRIHNQIMRAQARRQEHEKAVSRGDTTPVIQVRS